MNATGSARFLLGDVFDQIATLPDDSVDLVLSSPPFLALRCYLPADHPDKAREIGSEPTPAVYLDTLLALVAALDRVLAPHGTLVFELGDTYAGSGGVGLDTPDTDYQRQLRGQHDSGDEDKYAGQRLRDRRRTATNGNRNRDKAPGWPLDKSLCGIPTLFAWSLAYGRNLLTGEPSPAGRWRIRNVIPWARPNPPVGALGDKWRPATSYVTVACRARDRWFDLDAVRTAHTEDGAARQAGQRKSPGGGGDLMGLPASGQNPAGAPPLDWYQWTDPAATHQPDDGLWVIPTEPYKGAHYATWPTELVRRIVECMCPREVCRTCGTPRRRVTAEQPHRAAQDQLASHIAACRQANGYERRDLAHLFPHYKNTESILAQFSNWERGKNVPTPEDWEILRPLLQLSDAFTPYIYGERSWTESTIDYVTDDGRTIERDEHRTAYDRGGVPTDGSRLKADRRAPDTWTDCGHGGDFRPGVVLDPFVGSGTTLAVAVRCGRDAIGIDLDPDNIALARSRMGTMSLVVEGAAPLEAWGADTLFAEGA